MGNCAKLKWNRKRLKMSQQEFANLVGVSMTTIRKLETDETAWATLRSTTVDKICAHFDSMSSWQPERADRVIREINAEIESEVDEKTVPELPVVCEAVIQEIDKGLTKEDEKTMYLLEFIFEGLKEVKDHDSFVTNIAMLKRAISQY